MRGPEVRSDLKAAAQGGGRTREQEAMMAQFVLRSLRRALVPNSITNESFHFHSGPQGQPEVCFEGSCNRPQLEVC
jgi:hypothetical protein